MHSLSTNGAPGVIPKLVSNCRSVEFDGSLLCSRRFPVLWIISPLFVKIHLFDLLVHESSYRCFKHKSTVYRSLLSFFFLQRTERFQRNLASTSCFMDLQFSPNMPRPRVLNLSQPTSMDVSALLRHVS